MFAELEDLEPEGFTYKVFRLEDGVSFIHWVIEHDVEHPESLAAVPAGLPSALWRVSTSAARLRRWRRARPSLGATDDLSYPHPAAVTTSVPLAI